MNYELSCVSRNMSLMSCDLENIWFYLLYQFVCSSNLRQITIDQLFPITPIHKLLAKNQHSAEF